MPLRIRELLLPRQPEPIGENHWTRMSRLRLVLLPILAICNWLAVLVLPHLDGAFDVAAYERFLWLNIPSHAVNVALNAWTLRRARSARTNRAVAALSLTLEGWSAATALYVTGSVTSGFNALWFPLLIATYRIYFDARLGLQIFVTAVLMHGGLVALQLLGAVRTGAAIGAPETLGTIHTLGYLTWYVIIYALALVFASVIARRNVELVEARRHIARIVDGDERHGRLAGALLAGRYELGPLIGRGGMGEVYGARRTTDDREVAVKLLHPFHTDDATMLQRFQREAEVAARVAEGFVPSILEVGTTDEGQHYIVMERLRGEDLERHLKRKGRLEPARVVELVTKIAHALDAVHGAGAIHRDLKPSNVFLVDGDELSPRLLDFGVSKLQDEAAHLTQTVAIMGSPGFMAPEAARGTARDLGPPADVFALGVIAYLALAGERPFPASDVMMFIYEVLHETPRPVTELVPALHADVDLVLAVALAKEPAQRYPRATELAHELAAALAGQLAPTARARAAAPRPLAAQDTLTLDG